MRLSMSLETGLLGAMLLIAACAPAAPQPAGTNPGRVAEPALAANQTLTVGTTQLAPTLDAHANIGQGARRYGLFEMLVDQKPDGSIEPSLASAWRLVDDSTWEFTLVQGRRWHDGTPVTAEDVKFSIDRAIDPANKLGVLTRVTSFKSLSIVNPTTVRLTTTDPDPILLKRAAAVSIFPKAYLQRVGDTEFGVRPIGSGPYRLKEWIPDDRLVLTSVPEHPARPTITEVTIRRIVEPSALLAGLRTGVLDIIDRTSLEQARRLETEGYSLVNLNPGRSMGFWINLFIPGPLQDKRVRQAINYAIDKESIAKNIYFGFTKPEAGQVIQADTFGFNPGLKAYPYDPQRAKALLAQAGYASGFKAPTWVNPSSPEWPPTALFIQQQLKDVGIELDVNVSADSAAYQDRFYGRVLRPELLSANLSNNPALDASFALDWFRSSQPEPQRRYANPEFDRYYEPSLVEMNEAKRLELIRKALEVFHEDPPFVMLVSLPEVWAAAPGIVGLVQRPDAQPKYEQMKRVVR